MLKVNIEDGVLSVITNEPKHIGFLAEYIASAQSGKEKYKEDYKEPEQPVKTSPRKKYYKKTKVCTECGKVFRGDIGLGIHKRKIHGVLGKVSLREKQKSVLGIQKFPCRYCYDVFTKQTLLTNHEDRHIANGDKRRVERLVVDGDKVTHNLPVKIKI